MRLADGPTTEVEVYIDAPADVVWSYVSDIDLPARFSSELHRCALAGRCHRACARRPVHGQQPPRRRGRVGDHLRRHRLGTRAILRVGGR